MVFGACLVLCMVALVEGTSLPTSKCPVSKDNVLIQVRSVTSGSSGQGAERRTNDTATKDYIFWHRRRNKRVLHEGKDCSWKCGFKEGECAFCGAGICCRPGSVSGSGDCKGVRHDYRTWLGQPRHTCVPKASCTDEMIAVGRAIPVVDRGFFEKSKRVKYGPFNDELQYDTISGTRVVYFEGTDVSLSSPEMIDEISRMFDHHKCDPLNEDDVNFYQGRFHETIVAAEKKLPEEFKSESVVCVGYSRGAVLGNAYVKAFPKNCGTFVSIASACPKHADAQGEARNLCHPCVYPDTTNLVPHVAILSKHDNIIAPAYAFLNNRKPPATYLIPSDDCVQHAHLAKSFHNNVPGNCYMNKLRDFAAGC